MKTRFIVFALLLVTGVFLFLINKVDFEEDRAEYRLDSAQQSIEALMLKNKIYKDSIGTIVDSLVTARTVVIEKIKPVVVPVKYDGLESKQLEIEMLKAYKRRDSVKYF